MDVGRRREKKEHLPNVIYIYYSQCENELFLISNMTKTTKMIQMKMFDPIDVNITGITRLLKGPNVSDFSLMNINSSSQ